MAKPTGQMSETQLTSVVKALLMDAIDYRDEISAMRVATTSAYEGDPYGDEVAGRSTFVTREVRDAVETAKPQLMRLLFGSYQMIEFTPATPDDVDFARDATNYAYHVVNNDNRGYMEMLSAVEDMLIRKTGVLKAWWQVDETPVMTKHRGLTKQDLDILAADEEVTVIEAELSGDSAAPETPDPSTSVADQQALQQRAAQGAFEPVELYDAEITRVRTKGRVAFEAVPPEEYVVSRDAKSGATATLSGHYRPVTLSDLMVMGYEWDEVEDLGGSSDNDMDEEEEEARSVGVTTTDTVEDGGDPSQAKVDFAELWVNVDFDGDGIAERRRICVAGSGFKILTNELADYSQIVDICGSPVAHQVIGRSLGELVEDLQHLKTMTLRNVMDSLASAIHPDIEMVEGQVNVDDVLNTELGRVIRVKNPGMLRYLSQPFLGKEAFPVLQYLDTATESRTGMNQAAEGLNADALQSTSTQAIQNASQAATSRIEFIARTMIEGGLNEFFKLILRLAVQNVDRDVWIRVNRRFKKVNPASWDVDMGVEPAIALGAGNMETRITMLRELAAKQEQAIQTGGPNNPVAGLPEYRNTLAEIARLSGLVDVDRYLRDPTDPQYQPGPQPPSPEQILAEAEQTRMAREQDRKDQEFLVEAWKSVQEDDRQRDKIMADAYLKAEELRLKYGNAQAEQFIARVKADTEATREQHGFVHNMMQNALSARQQATQEQQTAQQPQQGTGPATGA